MYNDLALESPVLNMFERHAMTPCTMLAYIVSAPAIAAYCQGNIIVFRRCPLLASFGCMGGCCVVVLLLLPMR